MAPVSHEDQFRFLISCIRWSNNGKVDFTQVANECTIVSKGAAAKRYERMMKAHGIPPNPAATRPSTSSQERGTKGEPQTPRNGGTSSKKRKMDAYADDGPVQDDQEDFASPARRAKSEPDNSEVVKQELTSLCEPIDLLESTSFAPYQSMNTPRQDMGGFGSSSFDASSFNNDAFGFGSGSAYRASPSNFSGPSDQIFGDGSQRQFFGYDSGYGSLNQDQSDASLSQPEEFASIVINDD